MTKIDIGCGNSKEPGFTGIDSRKLPGVDVVCDFEKDGLPYGDSTVDVIRAWDFIEHIADKVYTFREFWRVCKPGATVRIQVPDASWGQGAFRDPTHKSYWVPQSFLPMYMTGGRFHPGGFSFKIETQKTIDADCVRWIRVVLTAVK
jgi:predicted SAM-dependent methyltransferase